ncbi:hypothetical protein CGCA056_v015026 [Colletotrichum aenigma]|uniref:uncharacterized protein n=1 Tax=Colletotrichum aenigma TaxID=1215731 RepID=UPI00187286DC|nr:uncharacterized protein CGCA056_v015098 [Colletotrichum aenigma]XP_037171340.1 uncharacterized protein CGCA056_v015026 [Colletotrichum aenigma]KAF5483150.1 hypothetical protein CGCA056_v015098 [Colletotrichum aenigma]KAF5492723.1 hypothetical protein CGCA056_v015026 [Colletotrichum aenigma]
MHWSLATLGCLLAASASAVPLATQHVPGLAAPVLPSSAGDLGAEDDAGAHVHLTTAGSLVGRDIKKGWFSAQEAAMLQKESESDVNFFHLMDSLDTLSQLLDRNRIPWAVAGGLALKIHGQPSRYTGDIDIVVQTTMSKLKTALSKDKKFILPGPGWPSDSHLRVYHNQGSSSKPKYIEVDMIIAGTLTTPENLRANSKDIQKETRAKKALTIHVMRLGKIFKSKVYALAADHRNKNDKDMKDISWIIEKTPGALVNVQQDLTYDLRQLVIMHLVRLRSPLVAKARELLGVDNDARLHAVPAPQIVGVPPNQEPGFVSWLFDGTPGHTVWG